LRLRREGWKGEKRADFDPALVARALNKDKA
jgi:hypothetical protein